MTGVSGARSSLSQRVHFSEMNENLSAYAIGNHKHKPEIEQYLSMVRIKMLLVVLRTTSRTNDTRYFINNICQIII